MKTITPQMRAHLDSGATTLASCWQITRTDGQVYRYTDHDADIELAAPAEVAGTYKSRVGYTGTNIANSADNAVDNLDVTVRFADGGISAADIEAGLFDYAEVRLFLVNWADPDGCGIIRMRRGYLGEVKLKNGWGVCELRGLMQALQQPVGDTYSPACTADLGDARCKINLPDWTVTGTVSAVTDRRRFSDSGRGEAEQWFRFGKLTFTSGLNAGRSMEVKAFDAGGAFELFQPMPHPIQVGDTYSVHAGCDKRHEKQADGSYAGDCKNKFGNVVNYRGHPCLVGPDQLLRYPDAK